jgi:hypothetical protein
MDAQINQAILSYQTATHDWCLNNPQSGAGKPLKEMTVVELRQVAKRMDIVGRSTMKKSDLIKAIRKVANANRRR